MRKLLLAGMTLALAAGLLACGSKGGKTSVNPAALLSEAADTMDALPGFHFLLTHKNGASAIALGLAMTRAEGDFVRPDKFRADVSARVQGGFVVNVTVVNVGDKTWISNPFASGQYQLLPEGTKTGQIFDPQNGLIAAVRKVEDPKVTGAEKVSGVETVVIGGKVDAAALSSIATAAEPGRKVDATVWIGKQDHRIYRIRLVGPLTKDEPSNIERDVALSGFGKTVEVTPPAGQ